MREIKFRAWLKDCETKKPYGLYFDLESISQGSIMARDGEWHYLVNLKHTTEQFTGLRDKNGREIYEGDILRFPDNIFFGDSLTHCRAVEWEEKYACFSPIIDIVQRDHERFVNFWIHLSPVVVGNIHENPELLG